VSWSDSGLWAFINFVVLAFLIVKYGAKPIGNIFKARQEDVERAVAAADRALGEAQQTLAEAKQVEAQEARILGDVHAGARTLAASLAADIDRESVNEAEHVKAAARAEIERERHALLSEARATLLREAFALAEQRIRDGMSPERHRELFEEFAGKAGEVRP